MIDLFVLLTPLLLLGVVALLGFAGCVFHAGSVGNSLTCNPPSGPIEGGTPVTITAEEGTFGSNVTATFGNAQPVPATYVVGSDYAQVTATTPPQQSAGPVTVKVNFVYPPGSPLGTDFGDVETDQAFTYTNPPVTLLQAALTNTPASGNNPATAQAMLNEFGSPNKLVVVTVQWGGTGSPALSSNVSGVNFNQVAPPDTFLGPHGQVATYYAFVDLSNGLTVTATVPSSPETDLSLLVSAYDNVDAGVPANPASQQNNFVTGTGTGATAHPPILAFQTSSLASGDLIYAVAIERANSGVSGGNWAPGAGFTAPAGAGTFIMLEYHVLQQADINPQGVNVTATDATAPNSSYWYLFAMAIKQA